MSRYSVNVYDRAGEFERNECGSFELALAVLGEKRRAYPRKVVQVFNLDRCDYDTNGLTEDEREAVDNVTGTEHLCQYYYGPEGGYCYSSAGNPCPTHRNAM